MFGLMRAKACGMSAEEKQFRRLNYCGTCKTIGALYSQKSRLLLNHDTVFLAEILTALSGEDVSERQNSYQSYNCLSIPQGELPLALEFAATTNIILTEFKLADHISDEKKRRYKYAQKAFSTEFAKAETLLKKWDFPLEKVRDILLTQNERESQSLSLEELAAPTAQTTAEFFAHGAQLVGKSELKDISFQIGSAFGKLIYSLDAFEDYEKDFRENKFNALRAVFQLTENHISAEAKQKVVKILRNLESEIVSKIYELPLTENQKSLFVARLQSNLQRKLKTHLPVLKTHEVCKPKRKQTFSQKWQNASKTAKDLAKSYSWQMPLVFLFIFAFALVAPAQTKEAKSARECFDLGFNLMFLGAIFGSVLAPVRNVFMEPPVEQLSKKARRKLRQQAEGGGGDDSGGCCDWCDCCDCDCCDGCDCDCCSGCDCGGCCDCDCDC